MLDHAASSIQEAKSGCCFDAAAALERLDGDQDLFEALIEIFHQDSVQLFEQLSTNLACANLREVERAAHSLKGLAANFDAKGAMEAAFHIEDMARSGVIAGIEPRVQELAERLEELRTALARGDA